MPVRAGGRDGAERFKDRGSDFVVREAQAEKVGAAGQFCTDITFNRQQ